MKKLMLILSLLIVMTVVSNSEESVKSSKVDKFHGKTMYLGVNPLGLILNIYSGQVGFMLNEGASEFNIPFFYWSPIDDLTLTGAGVEYLWYKDKNGAGLHYGVTFSVFSVTNSVLSGFGETKDYSWITYTPGGKVGYRWVWDNGFTLAPSIGLGYMMGEADVEDGVTLSSEADPGLTWDVGLGFAFMW